MFVLTICALVAYANAANRLCHGNIDNLHPSGEANGGVAASNNDAQIDMNDLNTHRNCYEASADKNCIQSSVLGGIASRESRGGRLLVATGGYGDNGNAWGIMQVHNNHRDWSQDQALQGGVAAYNGGVSRVTSWAGVDSGTTGRDYSNDVIARAKYLKSHGWN